MSIRNEEAPMVWKKFESTRLSAFIDNYAVAGIFQDSSGAIRAWTWPLGQAEKHFVGSFLSVGRALEAIENDLGN
jgi:hypothetical protein